MDTATTGTERDRNRALALLGGSVAASALLLVGAARLGRLAAGEQLLAVERDLLLWFHGWSFPGADWLMHEVSQLSEGIVLVVLVVVVAGLVGRRHRAYAGLLLFVYPASLVVHWTGKLAVSRPRPGIVEWPSHLASGSSYPSGHALEAAATYTVLAFVVTRVRARLDATVVWSLALVMILFAGLNRLYLAVHWPTDILAGWVAGFVLAGGSVLAYRVSDWQRRGP